MPLLPSSSTASPPTPAPPQPPPPSHLLPQAASLQPSPPDALLPKQATGLVVASQANFMRVIVGSTPPGFEHHSGADLLYVLRVLLKKICRRVLVRDRMLVRAVDWTDRRRMIEDEFERRSEVADPPMENIDQLIVLFSLDQPRPEPATLTKFLVEAESTRIPFMLVFNKVGLIDE